MLWYDQKTKRYKS